jgi:hypothetical protein
MNEKKKRGVDQRPAILRSLLAAVCTSGALWCAGPAFADTETQQFQPIQIPKTDMKSGKITARHERSVEIGGREYEFHKQVVFVDDEGERRTWNEFKKGNDVQYRLSKGQIDLLVLVPAK